MKKYTREKINCFYHPDRLATAYYQDKKVCDGCKQRIYRSRKNGKPADLSQPLSKKFMAIKDSKCFYHPEMQARYNYEGKKICSTCKARVRKAKRDGVEPDLTLAIGYHGYCHYHPTRVAVVGKTYDGHKICNVCAMRIKAANKLGRKPNLACPIMKYEWKRTLMATVKLTNPEVMPIIERQWQDEVRRNRWRNLQFVTNERGLYVEIYCEIAYQEKNA